MKILRASDHKRMPWKNGGGVTTEIAAFPADADLDTFGWRISMADVSTDGPFSMFPGVDRTLALLEGTGMRLEIAGRAPVDLTPTSTPLAFPADIETSATLKRGPILDLNVMTRRGQFTHRVDAKFLRSGEATSIHSQGATRAPRPSTTTILFCSQGFLSIEGHTTAKMLSQHDALVAEEQALLAIVARERALLFVITLTDCGHRNA